MQLLYLLLIWYIAASCRPLVLRTWGMPCDTYHSSCCYLSLERHLSLLWSGLPFCRLSGQWWSHANVHRHTGPLLPLEEEKKNSDWSLVKNQRVVQLKTTSALCLQRFWKQWWNHFLKWCLAWQILFSYSREPEAEMLCGFDDVTPSKSNPATHST